ncbi:caspase family protein [Spirulina sp. CS-785/01]|uniref:caspase family protein n=1 Tax=Spirulina sp. CS-785/01 TaxID=3021716 RepID=UPI00232E18E9|nr:caspase family protein [Spirulina sp. CS-785/01]MDB9314344.1 caspase family protein [Spirulina sp. CS-785/01]
MADYTSLSIGINRYQYIQPLSYAQQDAQAVHQRLREETGLPPQDSLLLTDTSPWVGEQSTEPTKANILHWLENWLNGESSSLLWFFFSGYGVSWEGDDYLMPIDGNPGDIPNTGIPAKEIFGLIREKGFHNVLVLLDINRSPGVIAGESVGAQIAEIAPEMGISLILSSQIEEASHEEVSLGHGIFTATLLEALRYYGPNLTLHNLSGYLYEHLPELSEHHWRPVQHPLIVIPSMEFAQKPLLPQEGGATYPQESMSEMGKTTTLQEEDTLETAETAENNGAAGGLKMPELPNFPTSNGEQESPDGNVEPESPEANIPTNEDENIDLDLPPETASPPPPPTPRKKQPVGMLIGAGVALIAALVGIFWFVTRPSNTPVASNSDTPTAATSPTDTASPGGEQPVEQGNANVPPPSPEASPSPSPSPEASPSPTPSPEALEPAPATMEASERVLARARTYIQSNQASGFSQAIREAQRIQPNAPLYQEAQADIARWSAVILDIAKGRANQGNFPNAIAAARLVPSEQETLYAQAQQSIQQWQEQAQQQQANIEIIQEARRTIRYTQASSYNQAIKQLQQIPEGQPGYAEAQDLIGRWSRQIYLIANSRASRGEFDLAVQTAKLVPEGTPSYEEAQGAIGRWQQGE